MRIRLLGLLALLSVLSGTAFSAPTAPLFLTSTQSRVPLSGRMEVLKDETGKLTIQDLLSEPRRSNFKPIPGNLTAGYLKQGAIWLRFTLQRSANSPSKWILETDPAYNEQLQLFLPAPGGGFDIRYGGSLRPFSQREILYRLDQFRLTLPPDQPQTIHLRIASTRNIKANPILWQPDALGQSTVNQALGHGAYLGIILLTVSLNLIYWIRLREPLYGYYLFYVLCVTYTLCDEYGYTHQFIWTDETAFQTGIFRFILLLLLSLNAAIVSEMLDLRNRMPRFDYRFRATCLCVSGLGVILLLAGFQQQIRIPLQCTLLLAAVVSITVSIRLIGQAPGATYFLAAFGVLLIQAMSNILINLGLLPSSELVLKLTPFCTLAHIMVINIAIINRMLSVRDDKRIAETALATERVTVEQQRQFFRLLSHELRTPLAIIDSTAQILPLLLNDPAKFRKKTVAIHAASQRMKALMDKCLINERLSMEGVVSDMQSTDIRALLQTTTKRVQNESHRHQVNFVQDGVPDKFSCDPFLLDIMIGNLLENAVKYSPQGGPVTLRGGTDSQGELLLEVQDNGVGISPEQAERIFERFYRAGLVPGVTGAGLGLYLVRRIALLHGGDVSCRSSPGHGSSFTVTLHPAQVPDKK